MIFINVGNCDTELRYKTLPLSCHQVSLQQKGQNKDFLLKYSIFFSVRAS